MSSPHAEPGSGPDRSADMDSPLGVLRVTVAGDAIRSVSFLDAPQDRPADADPLLDLTLGWLRAYLAGDRPGMDLPLAPEGTAFQRQVWAELVRIPYGQTTSYGDIARRLGDIKRVRAVGAANGRNPIAVLVPCHRVIGADGALVGYAGGLHRKSWLLDHERRGGRSQMGLFGN